MFIKTFIQVEHVQKYYQQLPILKNISVTFEKGEQYVIMGASGSGKSTFLYLLGGIEKIDTGSIKVEDRHLEQLSDEELAYYRNQKVGFVFQFHFLLSSMNCWDNLCLPYKIGRMGALQLSEKDLTSRLLEYARLLKVEHCLYKFPFELSGGEQQRINLIRAISLNPPLLLCDEPTGNLDSKNSHLVVGLLKELSQDLKSTLILVTHDKKVASTFSNHFLLEDGELQIP